MASAVFTTPTMSVLSPLPKLYNIPRKKSVSCSAFPTSNELVFDSRKFVTAKPMAGTDARVVAGGSGDERSVGTRASPFEQEALIDAGGLPDYQTVGGLHRILNRLSKWLVAVTFGGLLLLRHDPLALWAAMGSVVNVILSTTLKKVLNQERPVSTVSSGPGMPSSHAQSFFYTVVVLILSIVEWLGLNGFSTILSGLVIALGSYFAWLRVALHYHTPIQVVVGAVVGSLFSISWFWTWNAVVLKAYNSYLWVQILVLSGTAFFCVGFVLHAFRTLACLMEDQQRKMFLKFA